jgi:hypothetical protein
VFQTGAIEHRDQAAAVVDQPGLLQLSGRFGNTLSAHPQHVRDQFLRHRQLTARQPIQRQQQPATQLLIDRAMAIAYRRLRHLGNQCLGIAQQQKLQLGMAVKLVLEHLPGQTPRVAGALHQRQARGALAAHEQGNADHASWPTTAISPNAPFSITYNNDTMASMGK